MKKFFELIGSRSGDSMIGAMVAMTIVMLAAAGFSQILNSTIKGQRSVQSNADLVELMDILRASLSARESCIHTGLSGVNLANILPPSGGALSVSIRSPASAGPGAILAQAGFQFKARMVSSVNLSNLVATPSIGPNVYLATFSIITAPAGATSTVQKQNQFPLYVELDSSKNIVNCSMNPVSLTVAATTTTTWTLPSNWSCQEIQVPFTTNNFPTMSTQQCPADHPFFRGVVLSQEKKADDTDFIRRLICCTPA